MKYIDMDNWVRKNHFAYFTALTNPHLNVCANVDVTEMHRYVKANKLSFFKVFLYLATRTANEIKEFRYRIRDHQVVEHEAVHPSFTLMTTEEVFRFCEVKYDADRDAFLAETARRMEEDKNTIHVEDDPERDDLLFVTSVPWVSFTSVMHPLNLAPVDSVPRIAWGKFFEENGRMKMPLSIQAHHAVVDGVHVGKYFMRIQELLNEYGD